MQIDIDALFEETKQKLARVEQREAFLRAQLEEAAAVQLKLIGQIEMLRDLAQAQADQSAAPGDNETVERAVAVAEHATNGAGDAAHANASARTPRGQRR